MKLNSTSNIFFSFNEKRFESIDSSYLSPIKSSVFALDALQSLSDEMSPRDFAASCLSSKTFSSRFCAKISVGTSAIALPCIIVGAIFLTPFVLLGLIPVLFFGALGVSKLIEESAGAKPGPGTGSAATRGGPEAGSRQTWERRPVLRRPTGEGARPKTEGRVGARPSSNPNPRHLPSVRKNAPPHAPRRRNNPALNEPPFVPGQPVGLRNLSNDCWANASFQLVMNSARLRALMPDNSQITELMDAYEYTQRGSYRFVRTGATENPRVIGGECIRKAILDLRAEEGDYVSARDLNPATRFISSSSRSAEDAASFFESLLGNSLKFCHKIGERVSEFHYPDWAIHLPGDEGSTDFEARLLLGLEEDVEDLDTDSTQVKMTQFADRPEEFLVHIRRFFQTPDVAAGRMRNHAFHGAIQVPSSFTLPSKYQSGGEEDLFDCKGFIVHSTLVKGNLDSGHYVAYVKDKEGRWWLCNDRSVRQLAQESDVLARMPFGYIYHFERRADVS